MGSDNLQAPGQLDLPPGIGRTATRALLAAGFGSLHDLAGRRVKELLALHGVGPKAIRIIQTELVTAELPPLVD